MAAKPFSLNQLGIAARCSGAISLAAALGLAFACSTTPRPASDLGGAAGFAGSLGGAGSAGNTASIGSGLGGSAADFCSAQVVLKAHCQSCHGAQPLAGAPMPLITWNDLQAPSKSNVSVKVYQLVASRIHDAQSPMPPLNQPHMSSAEIATLDAWISGGALAGSNPSCTSNQNVAANGGAGAGSGAANGGAGAAGGAGVSGMAGSVATAGAGGSAGSAATAGSGGTTQASSDWPADCDHHYTFLAHGQSGATDTTPFNVSGGPGKEFYECFFFKVPWGTDQVQALQFRPIIDDKRVVHHYIMYALNSGTGTDGQVGGAGCSAGAFVNGWAPGGTGGVPLPADVGLQMPSSGGALFGLEIHYNNTAGYTDARDRSGLEMCVTHKFRAHTAAVHWLGSELFSLPAHQQTNVVGHCTPNNTQPVHILGQSPHMHKLGTHAQLVINRAGGTTQVVHDMPFNFADQQAYTVNDIIVNPGDQLTTTCTYNNTTDATVNFGQNTTDEMCFNFVTAYPAGGLTSSGFLGGGANHCLQ